MAIPAMIAGERCSPWLSPESESDSEVGSTMEMVSVVKTVSSRPTTMPSAGCCSHPASMAVRTGLDA
jgi:hypothetical protein